MQEVASGPVDAVSGDPVLLAQLGLVLGVPHHVPEFSASVSELALVPVDAPQALLEVPAYLGLVPGIGGEDLDGVAAVIVAAFGGSGRGHDCFFLLLLSFALTQALTPKSCCSPSSVLFVSHKLLLLVHLQENTIKST